VLIGGVVELALRRVGVKPRGLDAAGLALVVPDAWTGFRLRPDVGGPVEWVQTNDLGMHAPRSFALARPSGVLRVAVLGSSVVYGPGQYFHQTIPYSIERGLADSGYRAEVLNFGTHSFNIVNISAMMQAYVHQFDPNVVVVVVDFQVGCPNWPVVNPTVTPPDPGIRRLTWREALLKRGAQRSALLTVVEDPSLVRPRVERITGLSLEPQLHAIGPQRLPVATVPGPAPSATNAQPGSAPSGQSPLSPTKIHAYERRRERDLSAPLAAMASFCQERSIGLYFVTPYGPYFDLTDEELAQMNVHHFLIEARRVYGNERAALEAELELITQVVRRVASSHSAQVIDMLETSRRSSMRKSADFSTDGIHLTAEGNIAFGRLIAARLARDLPPPKAGLD
jgi:hypothetical protein